MSGLTFQQDEDIKPKDDVEIKSSSFFPTISLSQLRQEMRIDEVVTNARLTHITIEQISYVNAQLKAFRLNAQKSGFKTIAETTDEMINDESERAIKYKRAVYCYVKSELLERYSDYDATGKVGTRAEAKQEQADDYKRMAHAAIADILQRPRVDCELV